MQGRAASVGVDVEERQPLEPLGGEAVGDAADAGEQVDDAGARRTGRDGWSECLRLDGVATGSRSVVGLGRASHGGESLLDVRGRASRSGALDAAPRMRKASISRL
jgi:hypothetical protein